MIDLTRVLPLRRSITHRKDQAARIRMRAAVYRNRVTEVQDPMAVLDLCWIIAHAEMALHDQTNGRIGTRLTSGRRVAERYGITEDLRTR